MKIRLFGSCEYRPRSVPGYAIAPTWLNATVPCDRPGVHIGFVVEVSGASPVALCHLIMYPVQLEVLDMI